MLLLAFTSVYRLLAPVYRLLVPVYRLLAPDPLPYPSSYQDSRNIRAIIWHAKHLIKTNATAHAQSW